MIIITILIISTIIILMSRAKNNEEKGSDFHESEFEKTDTYETGTEITQVKNKNKYYAVEKILNTYIRYIKEMKGIIDFQQYDDDKIREKGVSQLYNILDSEYILEYNIKKSDLQDKIKEYLNYDLNIKRMYLYEKNTSINIYIVYASLGKDDLNLIIKTDSQNMTFSIFLEDYIKDNKYEHDMYTENIKISDNSIEKNDDNQYKYVNITEEYMAVQYMNSLKSNLLNNIQYTYENLMEDEYKDIRFENFQNFVKYINNNKNELEKIEIKKFVVNYYDDYTEYMCMDQYENYYIFKENAIMDYTFKLDTYTILTENLKKTYVEVTNEQKVQININRFFQMINRQDYRTSYNCLADSFKNNYFKSEDEFKQFVQNNFFLYNDISYDNLIEENDNLYTCELSIIDLTNKSNEVKNINIVMQLEDNMEFKMSFSIK